MPKVRQSLANSAGMGKRRSGIFGAGRAAERSQLGGDGKEKVWNFSTEGAAERSQVGRVGKREGLEFSAPKVRQNVAHPGRGGKWKNRDFERRRCDTSLIEWLNVEIKGPKMH